MSASTDNQQAYDIRQHLAVLKPSKGSKTKYYCPVCDGSNLDIKPSTGEYKCFSNDCEPKDIRAAIDRLEDKPEWKPEKFVKPIRPKSQKDYFYLDRDGNPLIKVARSDDGKGKKNFYQNHWDGSKWLKGNPDEIKKLTPIYRYAEVQQAIERNELIFWVEGEATADLLWELGIAATTTIGGSGGYSSYGDYQEDLKGARLVLAPDRDANGLKYIGNVAHDFATHIESYYLAGTRELWGKPEGGMDIGDDIRDYQLTKEQILEKVISPDEYREVTAPKARSRSENTTATNSTVKGKDYRSIGRKSGINLSDAGVDEHGAPLSKYLKLELDLVDLYGSRLELNEMTREIELDRKPIDLNLAKRFVSKSLEYDTSTENCILALSAIATTNKYHPVREYLESLRHVPTDFELFDNIATVFLGNSDPLANKMMAKALVGAVARVMKPGTKVDTLTVLQGGQGFLKSTFLKVLGGTDWFCDDIRDLENKDELAKLARYWIVELAEVDYLMGRKEVESFKRFLSTTADTYRPPYGRANIRHERTCALFATTNKSEFLTDPTGDRRYWVIEVGGEIDCDRVIQNRDLIWATALAAFERGMTWWLNKEEEQTRATSHTQYRESDPWSDAINERFKSSLPTNNCEGGEWLTTTQLFDLLDIPTKDRSRASSNRVTKILKEWGFESKSMRFDEGVRKVWFRSTENVILQNIENIRLQSYKVTEPIESSPESQNFLLPNLLPNISDNGIGYSQEEDQNTHLLPNNESLSPSPYSTVTHGKPSHCNDSDGERNPVTLLPNIFQTPEMRENLFFKIGDQVRYVGTYQEFGLEPETVLTVVENCGEWVKTRTDDKKPISIPRSHLAVLEVSTKPSVATSSVKSLEGDLWA